MPTESFKSCGISVNEDGSEDGLIHCIKAGEVAEEAGEQITREIKELMSPSSVDDAGEGDDDPFADIEEDRDQLEENEVVAKEEQESDEDG